MKRELQDIFYLMRSITVLSYKQNYKLLDQIDLYPGQSAILLLVDQQPGITLSEVANLSCKEKATITTMVRKMEKLSFLRICGDENDRRMKHIYITEIGKYKLQEFKQVSSSIAEEMFHGFEKKDIQCLKDLLLKVKRNIERR